MIMEAVTDEQGAFAFPGWGPKRWTKGGIRDYAPHLLFFKPGYQSIGLSQKNAMAMSPEHMRSDWDGAKIPLHPFRFGLEEYRWALSHPAVTVNSMLDHGECSWKAIPRFLATMEQQRLTLASGGVTWFTPLDTLDLQYSKRCGSLKQYVLEKSK